METESAGSAEVGFAQRSVHLSKRKRPYRTSPKVQYVVLTSWCEHILTDWRICTACGADRQKLLIRELHHRVKNTLANVRAMMGATARTSGKVEEFVRDFSARIVSLADTHSMLTDDYSKTASLQKLLEGELRHYDTRDPSRITIDGPEVALVADLAIPVGMGFHELASNSAKFGALSRSNGRLEVRWTVERSGENPVVWLDWRERDGPQIQRPRRRGFGTTLLKKVVAVQCQADVELHYNPHGFHIRMKLPLRETRLVPTY